MFFLSFLGFLVLAFLLALVFRKAGYSGFQIILLFVPIVNIAVFVWFALTEWPIQKELRELKSRNVTPGAV
jgi:bacteriorhodopsin